MTEERLARLMVSVVDGLASPEEQEELRLHLESHPELRRELEEHRGLKATTDDWVSRLDVDLELDAQQRARSLERRVGVTLVLIGLAVLTGFGLGELMLDPEAPGWVKLGTGLSSGGGVLLLLSMLRERFETRTRDRYDEVIR